MHNNTIRGIESIFAICLLVVALSASANAGSLRQGSNGSSGAVTGSLPGQVLWTYYQTFQPRAQFCPPGTEPENIPCNTAGEGDNIIRLVNPNGAANANLAGARTQAVCAMIYVFDDDEEMGECCGCPLSSTQLGTFSVDKNLTSDWGLLSPPEGPNADNLNGAIAIVATAPNTAACKGGGGGKACNGSCDPTNVPGYSVTTTSNLLGSITHNQSVAQPPPPSTTSQGIITFGISEVPLFDDAGGDPTNLSYLQAQCGALVGNGTGGGICNCPVE